MGQQQTLLLILGIILIGIASGISYTIISAYALQVERDEIHNEIRIIAADAYQYKNSSAYIDANNNVYNVNGEYTGYQIPLKMQKTIFATYSITIQIKDSMTLGYDYTLDKPIRKYITSGMIQAKSNKDTVNKIFVELDYNGKLKNFVYQGEFH